MVNPRQLWVIAGGNGAGKSTFYKLYLAKYGVKFVNADLIAEDIDSENPEGLSYHAATVAAKIREDLISQGVSFCFETVFSHESKIDFLAQAKANGYKIILVYIHLFDSSLNEARVKQIRIDCVSGANHDLILWLDKPGMLIGRLIYKQIYCFECKVLEVRIRRVLFFGRAIALAYKEAMQNMEL